VILHGKKHLWGQPNRHYHEGLQSGDNTLNLLCVRVLLRSINKTGRYDAGDFLREYVAFMTTPDSHRDTYAESYHRAFFGNFARGIAPDRCAGAENHDTASIGGLVGLPPVIMAALREDDAAAVDQTLLEHLRLTHRSAKLERYASALGRLLPRLLQDQQPRIGPLVCDIAESLGFPAAKVVEQVNRHGRSDLHVIGGLLSPACYIEHSFPAVLYLAARYAKRFRGRPGGEHQRRRRTIATAARCWAPSWGGIGVSGDSRTLAPGSAKPRRTGGGNRVLSCQVPIMNEVLVVAHAAATLVMVGVIWFVQVVHYPLMARVSASQFAAYEHEHQNRTTFVVAPTMLIEAVAQRFCWLLRRRAWGAFCRRPE